MLGVEGICPNYRRPLMQLDEMMIRKLLAVPGPHECAERQSWWDLRLLRGQGLTVPTHPAV